MDQMGEEPYFPDHLDLTGECPKYGCSQEELDRFLGRRRDYSEPPLSRTPLTAFPHSIWIPKIQQVSWPQSSLPVEIFELITTFLTRSEVKTLRLVCREFEAKVAAQYFRNVVVPFRSELYDSLTCNADGKRVASPPSLFSNGMRIFESFGPHILRFALSLELDEEVLAYPPVKPTQEAVPAFWGIYRWPHESYHRYSDLKDLEQTADETENMKKALRSLTKVTNLGLCCDAGLGYLCGPDYDRMPAGSQQPVFATQDWRQTTQDTSDSDDPPIAVTDVSSPSDDGRMEDLSDRYAFKRKILKSMITDAGFDEATSKEAIRVLLRTEGSSLARIDIDERTASFLEPQNSRRDTFDDDDGDDELGHPHTMIPNPLIPTCLTRAQKELLLELEWAHRAMIQSYVIALTDNARLGCYNALTTLTIAKIPASHLHIFYRNDFWQSIPSLKNVALGVVADWRRVSKPAPGCIEDMPTTPVKSVGKVFHLLSTFIGAQQNIESLRFEWICGGEYAPCHSQRHQFILPAPFLSTPKLMTVPDSAITETGSLLRLPYLKHLSLKNCWCSPHVFLQTIRQMALSSLEKLDLESFSLTGPPTLIPQVALQPAPTHSPAVYNMAIPTQLAPVQLPGVVANTNANPQTQETLRQPNWMSWTGIIEHFSPGPKIRHIVSSNDTLGPRELFWRTALEASSPYIPQMDQILLDEDRYKLKCLTFRSCGHVTIDDAMINNIAVLPTELPVLLRIDGVNGIGQISSFMQHCGDPLLGRISPYIKPRESHTLRTIFSLTVAENDSLEGHTGPQPRGGLNSGRFSGVLEPTSVSCRYDEEHQHHDDDVGDDSDDDYGIMYPEWPPQPVQMVGGHIVTNANDLLW